MERIVAGRSEVRHIEIDRNYRGRGRSGRDPSAYVVHGRRQHPWRLVDQRRFGDF